MSEKKNTGFTKAVRNYLLQNKYILCKDMTSQFGYLTRCKHPTDILRKAPDITFIGSKRKAFWCLKKDKAYVMHIYNQIFEKDSEKEQWEMPYRLTETGERLLNLGLCVNQGFEYSKYHSILSILYETPSDKHQIIKKMIQLGFKNKQHSIEKIIDEYENDEKIEKMFILEWFWEPPYQFRINKQRSKPQ